MQSPAKEAYMCAKRFSYETTPGCPRQLGFQITLRRIEAEPWGVRAVSKQSLESLRCPLSLPPYIVRTLKTAHV